jgi:glyoxylase-like metal-dependent hydrolase (beta-lactamase superfamily II)
VTDAARLEVPIPWIGSVNLWLLHGRPLTLVDTGPATDEARPALERELAGQGVAVDDIELLLITHHHLDHSGLGAWVRERSGAEIVAHKGTARWLAEYHERATDEHRFTLALMAAHGVPEELIADSKEFFDYILRAGSTFEVDRVLVDGDRVQAGGRTLRVVFRPGHSATDTLFVDDLAREAFVGDHLLATITSGAELVPTELPGDERRRALLEYLGNLRATAAMDLVRCYTGHGSTIEDHRGLIDERMAFHSDRLDRIAALVAAGCTTAFEIAKHLWSEETAATQPILTVWEVVGHLDILVNRGTVLEQIDGSGRHTFLPRDAVEVAAATS